MLAMSDGRLDGGFCSRSRGAPVWHHHPAGSGPRPPPDNTSAMLPLLERQGRMQYEPPAPVKRVQYEPPAIVKRQEVRGLLAAGISGDVNGGPFPVGNP